MLKVEYSSGDMTTDALGNEKQQRIAFQLVPPGILQATSASTAVSQEDSEGGALIINTSEPQQVRAKFKSNICTPMSEISFETSQTKP